MRLIDADAIVFTHAIARSIDDGHNWNELCVTKDEIDDMPSVEPEERTAKVVKEDNIRICDNCSGLILIPFDKTEENLRKYAITGYKGHNIYFASYKYCPNCGAKLDWSGHE